jgi:hypothetical protein
MILSGTKAQSDYSSTKTSANLLTVLKYDWDNSSEFYAHEELKAAHPQCHTHGVKEGSGSPYDFGKPTEKKHGVSVVQSTQDKKRPPRSNSSGRFLPQSLHPSCVSASASNTDARHVFDAQAGLSFQMTELCAGVCTRRPRRRIWQLEAISRHNL